MLIYGLYDIHHNDWTPIKLLAITQAHTLWPECESSSHKH